jgi:TolB-like protein/DNA-binding winged helix-turn-helix (wHTH) protein
MTSELSARRVAEFDGWTLLRAPLELLRNGERVRLQEQPLAILEMLVVRPRELVTREELIARLWPKGVVDFEAGLNTAMRKLRAMLGDEAEAPRYIETVPRQGYRFVAALDPERSPQLPAPEVAVPPPEPPPAPALPRRGLRALAALVALIVMTTVATIFAIRLLREPPSHTPVRVAVLPFENLSPDPANAFFTDGMHEEILTALAKGTPELEVVSRTTMMLYRQTPKSARDIARELGATHVLEGTVRREADKVRITLQLIDGASDKHLWAQSFDRALARVMDLQSELAAEVATQLAVELDPDADRTPAPRVLAAYDLWLKGVLAYQNVGGGGAADEEIDRVEELFTQAIALDPEYAAAYADRARLRIGRFATGRDQGPANIAAAREDIAAAKRYASRSPLVLVREATLIWLVDGELDRALALIEQAAALGALNADQLMTQANFLGAAGQRDRSLELLARAAALDPGNPTIYRFWMNNLFAASRLADAVRAARDFDNRIPGRIDRGEPLFAYTGSTVRWRSEFVDVRRWPANGSLAAHFDLLRYENKLPELTALLASTAATASRPHSFYRNLIGAIEHPVAELRGWERLLAGDTAGAAREGRVLGDFLASVRVMPQSQWHLSLLEAEAALFTGDRARAIEAVRVARSSQRRPVNFAVSTFRDLQSARILAWASDHEGALALLESLSVGYPRVGPAAITRDPLLARPLGESRSWLKLRERLEAEIAANQSLL